MRNIPENVDIVVNFDVFSTVWSFEPVSEYAKQWVDFNVTTESWQWSGDKFVVDHRPAQGLLEFIVGEGLTCYHPHHGFATSYEA